MRIFKVANKGKPHIGIKFDYDPAVVEKVRQLPSRKWIKHKKMWTLDWLPFHAAAAIKMFPDANIEEEIRELAKSFQGTVSTKEARVTSDLRGSLYGFQVDVVDFIHNKCGRAILGDQMGLGKTVESLVYAEETTSIERVLIVCPASVLYKWEGEIAAWLPRLEGKVVETGKETLPTTPVHIMTYSIMTKRYPELRDQRYDLIILDECHYLKSYAERVQRAKAAITLGLSAPHVLGLSGTIMPNRPVELWNILHVMDPLRFNNFYENFGNRYCGGKKWNYQLARHLPELNKILAEYQIRHLKADVLDALPDLRRVILPVTLTPECAAQYAEVYKEVATAIRKMSPKHKGYYVNVLDELSMLRQCIGYGKRIAMLPWIHIFLEGNDSKLVIKVHHSSGAGDMVPSLKQALRHYGVRTITGGVSAKIRANRIAEFQANDNVRVMIITDAGGEGIDLYAASDILMLERSWTPAKEEQAEARLHRIGQKNAVTAWYPAARGTVDERLANMVEKKRGIISEVMPHSVIDTLIEDML